jgi:two-component system nitrate/nitrite response regulator NarL
VIVLDSLTTILTQLGHDVVAAVSTHAALCDVLHATQPDVLIMELRLGDVEAVDILDDLVARCPQTRFVILTGDREPASLHAVLAAGASGYVHKTQSMSVLLQGLERVVAGQIVIEASFVRLTPAGEGTPSASDVRRLAAYLTPRERQCLAMLTAGRDTTTIAATLGVSTTTVRSHIQSVLTKLGVHSRLEAASVAARHGLVEDLASA